jgi:hypothetical protein
MSTELQDFVLDTLRTQGAVVEPPAYGVSDVLLPDDLAARLGVEAFQRLTFDEAAAGPGITHLTYGHALVERLAELVCAAPVCTRFYINDVRLNKSGLAELARAALSFPNALLTPEPGAIEARALFHYVRFNFKAALVSD